jgi:putative ABC transport system permease protein
MWTAASPGFFDAIGQRLVAGRGIAPTDDSAAVQVVIVNRRFAETMYPGGGAIGRRIFSWRDERVAREIVGIVDDVRFGGVADTTRPVVYVPFAQDVYGAVTVAVRTTGDPAALTAPVRRALAALDPEIAMARVRTMEAVKAESVAGQRFNALLLGAFAGLAALLAAVGLYGLLSYSVTQRARELGVRLALGATRGAVLRIVLGRSLRLVAVGSALGLAGALGLTRVLRSLLFETEPTDPLTLAGVTALLAGVALLASYLPARRAARMDPASTLRAS